MTENATIGIPAGIYGIDRARPKATTGQIAPARYGRPGNLGHAPACYAQAAKPRELRGNR